MSNAYLSVMARLCISIFILMLSHASMSQSKTDPLLKELFSKHNDPLFREIISHPDTYRLQVIYTQINRDRNNNPRFTNYYFNYDPLLYFNPASMVKMPLAFLALEKLNEMRVAGVNKHTTIVFDASEPWHRPLDKDTTAANGLPSIAHFIKRAFLVSENDPYNRLYQFVGQKDINRKLHQKGYSDVRITRQFMGLPPEQNSHTNPYRFINANGETIYSQPAMINSDAFDFNRIIKLGKAHMNNRDSIINEPFDFTKHNNLSLETMLTMLRSVMFPKSVSARQRFKLTKEDYTFLYRYLSQYPSETPDPKYDEKAFYDSYVKFFFRDSSKQMPGDVRVFNKVGWSYGFLTDVSYVADFKNKTEYMLAATLYVNSDEVLNDGKYDYDTKGYPFLNMLGQIIYNYELNRKKTYLPDLSPFRIEYEERDPADSRKPLKDIDN